MIRPLLLLPLLLALGCATTPRRPLVTHDDTGSGGGFASLPPLQLQFFGQSAPIATGSLGVPAYASTISATSITLSAASGATGFGLTTGARGDFGTGVSDYITSDGTNLNTPVSFISSGTLFGQAFKALNGGAGTVTGQVADGASAVGVILDNTIALSTTGAKAASIRTNGAEKAYVGFNGEFGTTTTRTRGTITLSAGTGTATVNASAFCVCTDTTATAAVKCAVSGTTLTATGTTTDVIAYVCIY